MLRTDTRPPTAVSMAICALLAPPESDLSTKPVDLIIVNAHRVSVGVTVKLFFFNQKRKSRYQGLLNCYGDRF
jgi:hypothetical protein